MHEIEQNRPESKMIFKPFAVKTPLLKELRKKGLVSIEVADAGSVKVLTEDDLEGSPQEGETSATNKERIKRKKINGNKNGSKLSPSKRSKKRKRENVDQTNSKEDDSKKVMKKSIEKKNPKSTDGNELTLEEIDSQGEDTHRGLKRRKKKRGRKKKKPKNGSTGCNEEGVSIDQAACSIDSTTTSPTKGEAPKRERFDIQKVIQNEENFKGTDQVKYKVHYVRWNMNGKLHLLYSIMKSLHDAKFWKPTEIQKQTLEHSINLKNDIIVVSKTGTGKTLTFCIPILNNIVKNKLREYQKKGSCISKLRCLILVPTRELAIQILSHFSYINKYTHIYIATIIGGLNLNKQKRIISNKPEILVCTPGRLKYFLLLSDKINYLDKMKHVRYFACDEIDKMIETSFMRDINFIAKHLYKSVAQKKKFIQTFLLSATLGLSVHLQNENLAKLLNYVTIRKEKSCIINLADDHLVDGPSRGEAGSILPDGLSLNVVKCERKNIIHKLFYLLKMYFLTDSMGQPTDDTNQLNRNGDSAEHGEVKKIVIFVNTIKETKDLNSIFRFLFFDQGLESSVPKKYRCGMSLKERINIFSIHSKQSLKERMQSISKFSQSTNHSVMFCTDVLSRGIDLDKCDVIIQLSCPVSDITFVHRSGRTARNFKTGTCICFITDDEIARWKSSLKKIGLIFENLQELEMVKRISNHEQTKINSAILCCNKMIELQNKIKDNKNKSLLSKLAREAELEDEEGSSSDSDNPSGKITNETILKQLLRLKKELYSTLYGK
ncbi:RNA-helicase, putative [Plasmodium knowlesi strain H]|uniref:ATP-dependent RNA helicase n=3 Tax=Plasmodium knowlesi TaxID=5850 RepID=A0A5K1UBA1_PLAKH|nr:ATP-dependent RNA helicase MAK5, putative [Plasmodium knowlesi strain H]OTN65474.1 putative RNA helicase [Plasmodium knowlesi]CAA9989698.1 ATP-dependent RNA helicase MAK5, putative [Plasmodium knowlesi strain H]SBO22852.1 RNA-helicase, putative [Plasmodium knowlesi strain H]SBO23049.1 RNA-helicase, putative [Plasmodium knowlesi strain H]VVS79172.1 ATP-dependent RNA helicase MAK5, putative [Plasmodium knowlesi strain H]|eukprot:XP_002260421.1 RNA helicase, putative [Plasmodium knowlesi strain H]